jgi:hypothetical protein
LERAQSGYFWSLEGYDPCAYDDDLVVDQIDDAVFEGGAVPDPGQKFVWMRLQFYNQVLAETNVVVDAAHYVLLDRNEFRYPVQSYTWYGVSGNPNQTRQEILPGVGAYLDLVYQIPTSATPWLLQSVSLRPDRPTLTGMMDCWGYDSRNGQPARPHDVSDPPITFIFDRDSAEVGMITWVDAASGEGVADVILLRFTNTGLADWEIHPYDAVLENNFNQSEVVQWVPQAVSAEHAPDEPIASSVILQPGEEVTIRLMFEEDSFGCSRLIFIAGPGQLVPLGSGECSAGAGARPRLRTGS